jgi:glycosyltransferase involved in cell wall biosynthesis
VGLPAPQDFRGTWSNPVADAAVQALVARLAPDLVHVHHLAHVGFGVARAVQDAGVPTVVTLHDYHLICARGQLVDRTLNRCEGPQTERCGRCVAEHLRASPGLQPLARLASQLGLRGMARAAVGQLAPSSEALVRIDARLAGGRAVLSGADRVLSPSRHLGDRLERLGWLAAGAWQVQDLPLVAPLSPAATPQAGPVRVLFVGHLIPTKGLDVLVDAWARVSGGTLSLRGPFAPFDGQPGWERSLRDRVAQTPGVSWDGPFEPHERQAVYSEDDVLVVPSTWEENSPLVVREALTVGLRVVASDVGGLAELAPDARRVPPGDPVALAAALQNEVDAGRGRAESRNFPLGPHLAALGQHYEQVLDARRSHAQPNPLQPRGPIR